MDYEKAYKEALERAREIVNNKDASSIWKDWLRNTFPEIKENEDERIRKELIDYINRLTASPNYIDKYNAWITWLEKQGEQKSIDDLTPQEAMNIAVAKCFDEQKSADKVEPKFKVGDWITDGQLTCKVLNVTSKSYELHLYNDDYCHFETDAQSVDKYYHLWTIQDAKDGDVLVSKFKQPFIYNGNYNVYNVGGYCGIVCDGSMFIETDSVCQWADNKEIKPATKKQHALLFQKMKEAGYDWNEEKKELKKIEQKPTWSEEDEERLQSCLNILLAKGIMGDTETVNTKWLKSLKERIRK